MTRYRDPNAPTGRVVFGGEAFHDGITADITIGDETALLFTSAGIVPIETEQPETVTEPAPEETKPAAEETKAAKPASRRAK